MTTQTTTTARQREAIFIDLIAQLAPTDLRPGAGRHASSARAEQPEQT